MLLLLWCLRSLLLLVLHFLGRAVVLLGCVLLRVCVGERCVGCQARRTCWGHRLGLL